MIDTQGFGIESRRAAVAAWLASGLDIDIAPPTIDEPAYTAALPELGLTAQGATEDAALDALMARLTDLITAHMLHGTSLPDRSTGTGNE
jgi:hypothetical protein